MNEQWKAKTQHQEMGSDLFCKASAETLTENIT